MAGRFDDVGGLDVAEGASRGTVSRFGQIRLATYPSRTVGVRTVVDTTFEVRAVLYIFDAIAHVSRDAHITGSHRRLSTLRRSLVTTSWCARLTSAAVVVLSSSAGFS